MPVIDENTLFKYLLKYTSNKLQKNYLYLKEKDIKTKLKPFLKDFNDFLEALNLNIEDVFTIYNKKVNKFDYKDFLKNWKPIVLKELIKIRKNTEVILNFLSKNPILGIQKIPKEYLDFLSSEIFKNNYKGD